MSDMTSRTSSQTADFVFGFSPKAPEDPLQLVSEFGRGQEPRGDATGRLANAIGMGEAETRGEGTARFLGLPSVGPSGNGAFKVRINAARKIVVVESILAHNCVAEVVSIKSGQGLRFWGRRVGDDDSPRSSRPDIAPGIRVRRAVVAERQKKRISRQKRLRATGEVRARCLEQEMQVAA
jgi:hypothetical protein